MGRNLQVWQALPLTSTSQYPNCLERLSVWIDDDNGRQHRVEVRRSHMKAMVCSAWKDKVAAQPDLQHTWLHGQISQGSITVCYWRFHKNKLVMHLAEDGAQISISEDVIAAVVCSE